MEKSRLLALIGALSLAAPLVHGQNQTVLFSDASGLAAEAEVGVLNGGLTVAIRLRNTSTGVPTGFTPEDQLLSSIYFDFGQPGINALDQQIVGGGVNTGPGSFSLNFSNANVGPNKGVKGEYGFANAANSLMPNAVSSKGAVTTPFGGVNLHGNIPLGGPDAGLVPSPGPLVPLGPFGAIQDEIVIRLNVSPAVPDLNFLLNGMRVEFGDGAVYLDGNCRNLATTTPVPDPGGLNANGVLTAVNLPTIGNANFQVQLDDPGGACGITPGSFAAFFVSVGTDSWIYPGLGCAPGAPGEIMLDLAAPSYRTPDMLWAGPGMPVVFTMPIPNDPLLCGTTYYAQGYFTDAVSGGGHYILTNRLDVRMGM